jgi:Zn-dependent protease
MTNPPQLPNPTPFNRSYRLGKVLGLTITIETTALVSFIVLWVALAVLGREQLGLTVADVFMWGLGAALLHFVSVFLHHFGHALAAANVKYEMVGIHYYFVLGRSIYPGREPVLPASVHIQRAWGGPIASLIVVGVFGVLALLLSGLGGMVWYWALFGFWDNLLVLCLGALMPLPFLDGGTLRHYGWRPSWWKR